MTTATDKGVSWQRVIVFTLWWQQKLKYFLCRCHHSVNEPLEFAHTVLATIWFSIFSVLSIVVVINGYSGNKQRGSHGDGIFQTANYRCRHSVNKAVPCPLQVTPWSRSQTLNLLPQLEFWLIFRTAVVNFLHPVLFTSVYGS